MLISEVLGGRRLSSGCMVCREVVAILLMTDRTGRWILEKNVLQNITDSSNTALSDGSLYARLAGPLHPYMMFLTAQNNGFGRQRSC